MVTLIHTSADHNDDVNCCAFSSSCLATCSLDKTIRVYCLKNFTELPYSPLKGHTYAVHCCCFSPSGHVLASCSTDGTTMVWSTGDGRMLAVLEQPSGSPVRVCRFSPESMYLVSGAADGSAVLWNMQSLKLYRSGNVKDGSLVACAFSPNGNFFVTGSSGGDLTIWDDKMRCLYNEKAHDLGVTCCDISSQPISGDIVENESKLAVEDWSEDDVSAWLCEQDLADFVRLFKMNNIDGKELLNLTKESLTNELKIESLGLRSKVLQKIEELRMKMISVSVTIPDEFLCPITRELMKDPVIAADGYSYEKEAMENWLSSKRRSSPMTNLPLPSPILTPNRTLKMAISRWLETQQK
ncbi:WD repeat, SAM and U-box domain-containing protein 1 isoform X4 [Antrostomus carolinensis]|uniref:WD repeat, SAM and U-box domain-containing protein 1 isoform X4 n=1 Tax=Antrostomus carolinensis TaxID=279965 RepID=UPI0010A985F4|nr:WD repeat, SAM and U-box domain-containing protein 1 isoform X4 [Antrostomus carolinensis]